MKKKTKTSKNGIKKQYREQISIIISAIKAHCYQCCGFNGDGYGDCEIYQCPLYPFQINRGDYHSKKIRHVLDEVKRIYKTSQSCGGNFCRDHWFRFFGINNLAIKKTEKKTNLTQKRGGVNGK